MRERKELRDKYNNIIGFIDEDKEGNLTIRDKYNNIKGFYRASDNTTRDKYNNIVARGQYISYVLEK